MSSCCYSSGQGWAAGGGSNSNSAEPRRPDFGQAGLAGARDAWLTSPRLQRGGRCPPTRRTAPTVYVWLQVSQPPFGRQLVVFLRALSLDGVDGRRRSRGTCTAPLLARPEGDKGKAS